MSIKPTSALAVYVFDIYETPLYQGKTTDCLVLPIRAIQNCTLGQLKHILQYEHAAKLNISCLSVCIFSRVCVYKMHGSNPSIELQDLILCLRCVSVNIYE